MEIKEKVEFAKEIKIQLTPLFEFQIFICSHEPRPNITSIANPIDQVIVIQYTSGEWLGGSSLWKIDKHLHWVRILINFTHTSLHQIFIGYPFLEWILLWTKFLPEKTSWFVFVKIEIDWECFETWVEEIRN